MPDQKIVFECECGQRVGAPPGSAGRRARCPACGRAFTVPQRGAAGGAEAEGPLDAEPGSLVGRVCSVCQTPIDHGQAACLCPACRSPYHRECWDEIGGCATYGCDLMPQPAKPADEGGPRSEAWGDDKTCPKCGQEIRAAAVKCRFCRASFPSAVPMTRAEYREWSDQQAQLGPTRTFAIVLFSVSLIGCLAPIMFIVGLVWLKKSHDDLKRVGGVHQVLAYFGVALSAVYSLILLALLF